MFPWHGGCYAYGPWSWMPFFPFAMLLVALVFLWLMFGRPGRYRVGTAAPGSGEGSPAALEIARARYARGEISREEFEEIKRTLG